ncbi:hypothetical protein [Microbulbifer sp. 2205BS26-8]|uniref:hypothetical protein n=1 Tax=Microbulbifer sp. 2205BS26-8 TaxID=3064386 RepID=UPI00273DC552|nr:hypothetical protein [Microbulbifer sp. 2205BS26-8]MDP5210982.1 hypothetical protein [Microbulbifer sp. 2205BS26-8]
MSSSPPRGSKIKVDNINDHHLIIVPHGNGSVMRYFIGAFLLFWMGGWFIGFTDAFAQIVSGNGGAFLVLWLGGWSIGGIFAGYMIYRVFRKSIPEKIILNYPSLSLDTGIPPLKINFGFYNQKEYWNSIFPKRKRLDFSSFDLKTLTLRETDSNNRLTIDKDSERIEIAIGASEVDREWLYGYLKENYS